MTAIRHVVLKGALIAIALANCPMVNAGGPFRNRVTSVKPTASVVNRIPTFDPNANAASPMLGTFYATPYMITRGDGPTGGGYSPLGQYGRNTMSIYGPISSYRSISAPVRVYSRGYDGRVVESEALSFSTPFLPESSPVIYPTQKSNYFGPRVPSIPPWYPSGINWVDQN